MLARRQTYRLTAAGASEDDNQTGDLDCWGSLAIEGKGSTIDGLGLDRVLHVVAPRAPVTANSIGVTSLRITNGVASTSAGGGMLLATGFLRASHVTVDRCTAGGPDRSGYGEAASS